MAQPSLNKRRRMKILALVVGAGAILLALVWVYVEVQARRASRLPWLVPQQGMVVKELGGKRLPIPLVYYPGAQVQAMADASSAMRKPAFAVLLGTSAACDDVIDYYQKQLARFGKVQVRPIHPLRNARLLAVETAQGRQQVQVFRGSLTHRDVWDLPVSDEGEETKILIITPPPET